MISVLTCLTILFGCLVSTSVSQNGGFSSTLYHRDWNLTKMVRLSKAIDRDMALDSPVITTNSLMTDIKYHGTFLMKLALGTPPHEFYATADTGSDLTWIQCKPCIKCYEQNSPIFEPVYSSTYKKVMGSLNQTPNPPFQGADSKRSVCKYKLVYGDDSFSEGIISTDMLTIQTTSGMPIVVDHYTFGCGVYNQGTFNREQAGIIGLGRGPGSLINQLDKYIHGKFSYCLHPRMHGGKILFGNEAVVQGPGVVTTPLFNKNDHRYLATLEALTIGNERIEFNNEPGNIMLDSGATLTKFSTVFHGRVVDSVLRQIKSKQIQDPTKRFKVCYEEVSFTSVPITAHFRGADVVLNEYNMFQRISRGVKCLTIKESTRTVWGYTAQLGFLVGYDVQANTVSFKSTKCSDQNPKSSS